MRMRELAAEYGQAAELLRGRIRLLEEEQKLTEDEDRRLRLDRRLRPLRAMYRETRDVERHLRRYYERTERRKDA